MRPTVYVLNDRKCEYIDKPYIGINWADLTRVSQTQEIFLTKFIRYLQYSTSIMLSAASPSQVYLESGCHTETPINIQSLPIVFF